MLTYLFDSFAFQTFLKIVLGALLTGVIGLERSSLNKPAGFGTHALLGVSAVLVVICSEYMAFNYSIDMSRLPAQLLSGIGFIGAGTIMQKGLNVKGVTTAAGLLAVTCIGLTIGAGFYMGGIISTILVYLILAYAHNISDKFERFASVELEIVIEKNSQSFLESFNDYLSKNAIDLKGMKRIKDDNATETICIIGEIDTKSINKNQIIHDLISMKHVIEVNEQ